MKRIHALLLLILLLQIGAGGFFLLWQSLHQYKMQSQHNEGITFLHLATAEFEALHWEKKGKEFILEGKRYDVEKIHVENDKYIIVCVEDTLEEKIIQHLVSQYSDNQATNKKTATLKYPFFEYIYSLQNIATFIFTPENKQIIIENVTAYWFYDNPIFPPPQAC